MTTREERRAKHRLQARAMDFEVHIRECRDDPEIEGELLECFLVDFSGFGLRLMSDTMLVADTLLDIRIKAGPNVYNLLGIIRWEKLRGDHCHIGVHLKDAEHTDLVSWIKDYSHD